MNLDTTNSSPVSSSGNDETQYSPQQDSNYEVDSKLSLSFLYWIKKGILSSEREWQIYKQKILDTPSNNLTESFTKMPANIFKPLSTEIVQHQISLSNALSIPTIGIFIPGRGFSANLRDIGLLLGLVEDTSPEINYILNYTCDVEIVIYSVSAKVVATIFSGTQKQGEYKIVWNGKDDAGKKISQGDYIAEVRVGNEKFVRKRIVIGGY
jgi:hypothetical protein